MKPAAPAAVLLVFLAAACGKVGDPKPPINRSPLAASNFQAAQSGHQVTLSWINPARYVDANDITDLAFVRILRNGVEIAREKAKPAGQPQSYEIDVADSLNKDLTFSIQIETQRGRTSPLSPDLSVRPVDVPGAPRSLTARVDLGRIRLDWEAPERNANLAEVYLVQRSDWTAPVEVTMRFYEDAMYEVDMRYDYTVRAVRGGDRKVPGVGVASLSVTATDKLPPAVPTGLEIESLGAGSVFLKWTRNTEPDFKEVWVYRSDQVEPIFPPTALDGVADENYRPGLTYQLVAVDKFGNRSEKSEAKAGP